MEYLPDGFSIRQLRVEYRKSAVYGDVLVPERLQEDGKVTIRLTDRAGEPYVITEFTGKEIR